MFIFPLILFVLCYLGKLQTELRTKRVKLQKRAAQVILDCNFYTPSCMMFSEFKWMTFPERVLYPKAIQMFQTTHGSAPEYISTSFTCVRYSCNTIKFIIQLPIVYTKVSFRNIQNSNSVQVFTLDKSQNFTYCYIIYNLTNHDTIPLYFRYVAVLRYSSIPVLTSLYCQCICIHVHAFVSLCVNCFLLFEAPMED